MNSLPNAVWWIKADVVDVVSYLGDMEWRWSGDVDLNDRKLKKSYEAYCVHLQSIESVGLRRKQPEHI